MSKTIALVDDDRNILTSLSIALEREGFKVQTYIDGESALVGLSRNPPDLAVVDIKMPRMDGEELLKRIKKKMSIDLFLIENDSFQVINEKLKNFFKIPIFSPSRPISITFSADIFSFIGIIFFDWIAILLSYKILLVEYV